MSINKSDTGHTRLDQRIWKNKETTFASFDSVRSKPYTLTRKGEKMKNTEKCKAFCVKRKDKKKGNAELFELHANAKKIMLMSN